VNSQHEVFISSDRSDREFVYNVSYECEMIKQFEKLRNKTRKSWIFKKNCSRANYNRVHLIEGKGRRKKRRYEQR